MNFLIVLVVGLIGLILGSFIWSDAGALLGGLLGGLLASVIQLARHTQNLQSHVNELVLRQAELLEKLLKLQNKVSSPQDSIAENKSQQQATQVLAETKFVEKTSTLREKVFAEEIPTDNNSVIKNSSTTDTQSNQADKIIPPKSITSAPITPTAPPEPWPPRKTQPDVFDKLFASVKNFFTQGNPIVRVGMVVMFFGLGFLIKYAASEGFFPIEFRLASVLLIASALIVLGWRTRLREGSYGLVLQGGGVATIYLTLFAAAKLYSLIPLPLAFSLLFVVVIFGVILSLLQNAQVLAILATAGGFLAPILTSNGSGNYVGLFSFYLILNLGILAVAVYKSWRLLNWVGFIFTFVITTAWGVMQYVPENYASTQPFLIAFFALYLCVAILFSFKQPANLKGLIDTSLIFGLPLVAFGLQTLLLRDTHYGLAISAVVLALVYLVLAFALLKKAASTHQLLIQSFIALGLSFATLAIPLALDASWTAVSWALEATGLVWIGIRQARLRTRVVGYLLHIAAGFSMAVFHGISTGDLPIIHGDFLAVFLLALTSFTIAYLIEVLPKKYSNEALQLKSFEAWVSPIALVIAFIWWFTAGVNELFAHTAMDQHFAYYVVYAALTASAAIYLSRGLQWRNLGFSPYALLPYIIFVSAASFSIPDDYAHPLHSWGAIALVAFCAVQYRFLFLMEQSANKSLHGAQMVSTYHVLTAWLLFAWIFWEVSWQKEYFQWKGTSAVILWFGALMIPVMGLIAAARKKFWPFITLESAYKNWVPLPLFFFGLLWFFLVCTRTLRPSESYLPILNPLDLSQFGMLLIFAYAIRRHFFSQMTFFSQQFRYSMLGLMLFVWLNVVCLRAVSRIEHIGYYSHALFSAPQVQMTLSILWTLCALVVMNVSRRLQVRKLWILGAVLLALVVLKLFLKDLSGSGTLAGIVSFIVVGVLMLIIGYLSPIPSKKSQDSKETQELKGTQE